MALNKLVISLPVLRKSHHLSRVLPLRRWILRKTSYPQSEVGPPRTAFETHTYCALLKPVQRIVANAKHVHTEEKELSVNCSARHKKIGTCLFSAHIVCSSSQDNFHDWPYLVNQNIYCKKKCAQTRGLGKKKTKEQRKDKNANS